MHALAFDDSEFDQELALPRPRKAKLGKLSVHERFVLKAEAIFPGSEILFTESAPK